jgi:hypothetical protein
LPRKCRKNIAGYSVGELNHIVDAVLHPWIDAYPQLLAVDGLLHGLIEQDPVESIRKFLHYNILQLMEDWQKWLKEKSSRTG